MEEGFFFYVAGGDTLPFTFPLLSTFLFPLTVLSLFGGNPIDRCTVSKIVDDANEKIGRAQARPIFSGSSTIFLNVSIAKRNSSTHTTPTFFYTIRIEIKNCQGRSTSEVQQEF